MIGDTIKYQGSYKYVLREDYTVKIRILPLKPIITKWAVLLSNGMLTIYEGYAWDGPSGPTVDTPDFMRGSLIHDALYKMMRLGLLSLDYKCQADDILREICLEDGMDPMYAKIVYEAVSMFGTGHSLPSGEPPILIAPRLYHPVIAPEVGG